MRLNSKQIVQCTGGTFLIEPIDASEILTGITWDSRTVRPGDLYVALPGERVDGHRFVEAALKAGARGALVTESPGKGACILAQEQGVPIIEVPNCMHAVGDIASAWRSLVSARVIGVTGSVGKTTTKSLIRDVCAAAFRTVATEANQNNELGVPNTVLRIEPDTQVAVVEMGMRGRGQILSLCEMTRPEWGVITNVGESHMELLGSKENIARAKGELLQALPEGHGMAFLNAGDEYTERMVVGERLRERGVGVVLFGSDEATVEAARRALGDDAEGGVAGCVFPRDASLDAEGRPEFTLCARGLVREDRSLEPTLFDLEPDIRTAPCHLALRGEHNVANACAAAAVGLALGMDIAMVAQALEGSLSETGRLETLVARDGYRVINDAYNANPDSMRAALNMLAAMDVSGRRIAVLGDMGELGEAEVACHRGVGEAAAGHSIDLLVCVGELSASMADAALEAGMPPAAVVRAHAIGEVLELLEGNLAPEDVVLVKASHFMRLDRLVEGLVA